MFYNIHTHKSNTQENVIEIINQYPNEFNSLSKFFSIGIHPWYIDQDKLESDLIIIEEKIQLSNCFAIGECGLDKRIDTPLDLQIAVFEKQVALAIKYKKTLILHCVSAYQEIIEIKNRLKINVPIIIHGFSKNEQVAKTLIENGFYLSFGKYLLRNPELATVFKNVPNNQFFLETDMIEESIYDVYEKAASIKKENIQELVDHNFNKVFGKIK